MSASVEFSASLALPKKSLSYWKRVNRHTYLSSIAIVSPESR